MENEAENVCPICYEQKEDLRMLPCWHVACFTCILGMTQTGKGRAVGCHACRQPCLFENIRSLPQPVRCRKCKQFLKRPKKFPCCTRLYCLDCIKTIPADDWGMRCPETCNLERYQLDELEDAKICGTCFRMHTENEEKCGHTFCTSCIRDINNQKRECPLCLALKNPFPAPINPIQPSMDQVSSSLESVNNRPVTDNGQPISQMQLMSAMQTVRLWQQRNAAQQQRQLQQYPYTEKDLMEDIPKGVFFLLCFFFMGFMCGISIWMWLVCGAVLYITKPTPTLSVCIVFVLWIIAWLASIFHYFWLTALDIIFHWCVSWVLQQISRKFLSDKPFFRDLFKKWWLGVYTFVVWYYFPPLFLHRNVLVYVLAEFGGRIHLNQQRNGQ